MRARILLGSVLFIGLGVAVGCGDDPPNNGGGGSGLSGQTGQACDVADDCFSDVPLRDDIQGDFTCLDRVEGGYCTHECVTDADCCAVDEECEPDTNYVCGPFESTGLMICFIGCEKSDVGNLDADEYCRGYHRDFGCRSTGGGSANRKVCVPGGGGTACGAAGDCSGDFLYCCEDSFGDNRCYDELGASGRTCLNDPPI